MARFAIMTVGMTHSGKSTFARSLEKVVKNAVVIDQDDHAEFLNQQYPLLVPKDGPNKVKSRMTRMIVDYAMEETENHLILCNSNRNGTERMELLDEFRRKGFSTILVSFHLPFSILEKRVEERKRDPAILRTADSFQEVLNRQREESHDIFPPSKNEADHLFQIKNEEDVAVVIRRIEVLLSS